MIEGIRYARVVVLCTLSLFFTACLTDDPAADAAVSLSFTNPADVSRIQTPDIVVNIFGTAVSEAKINSVAWVNDRGGRGNANGKEKWVTGNIVLQVGANVITVTATDADGNENSKSIEVEREESAKSTTGNPDPVSMYSYNSNLSNAAPVNGASIDPQLVYFFTVPGDDWIDRVVSHVEYLCCKGISGPGEGTAHNPKMSVSFSPWSVAIDLTGLEPGGVRRLRTMGNFLDGSQSAAFNFDFTVAGGAARQNTPPSISGSPSQFATVGMAYRFIPSGTDVDGDTVSFSIENKPGWLNFNKTTGRLSGIPTDNDVGIHGDIRISVSDGKTSTSLAQFSIEVEPGANGSATISWNPPMFRVDGNPLNNDLAGYQIRFGRTSLDYSNQVNVENAGIASYVVDNLSSGTWYFAVLAYDSAGQFSNPSEEVWKKIL
jgi:hypothetical protein